MALTRSEVQSAYGPALKLEIDAGDTLEVDFGANPHNWSQGVGWSCRTKAGTTVRVTANIDPDDNAGFFNHGTSAAISPNSFGVDVEKTPITRMRWAATGGGGSGGATVFLLSAAGLPAELV